MRLPEKAAIRSRSQRRVRSRSALGDLVDAVDQQYPAPGRQYAVRPAGGLGAGQRAADGREELGRARAVRPRHG